MVFKAWEEETIHSTTQGGQVRNLSMVKKKQQQKAKLSSSLPSPRNLFPICLADSLSLFREGDGSSARLLPGPGGHIGGMHATQTTEGQCGPPLPCLLHGHPTQGHSEGRSGENEKVAPGSDTKKEMQD